MKVMRVSNYDDEGPGGIQRVVAGPGLTEKAAEAECRRLRDDPHRNEADWFEVVGDDYVPWECEP